MSTFVPASKIGSAAAPANVGAAVVPPPPAVATPFDPPNGESGNIYDAQAFLFARLNLLPDETLRLFHNTREIWPEAVEGQKTRIITDKGMGMLGAGFNTSTVPLWESRPRQFLLELPVKAFEGLKIFEVRSDGKLHTSSKPHTIIMPPGVDILAYQREDWTKKMFFIFKPGTDAWLNDSATVATFIAPGHEIDRDVRVDQPQW